MTKNTASAANRTKPFGEYLLTLYCKQDHFIVYSISPRCTEMVLPTQGVSKFTQFLFIRLIPDLQFLIQNEIFFRQLILLISQYRGFIIIL
jgi:hypothetical protein